MFDFYSLPIHIKNEKEHFQLPGFWLFKAPPRSNRNREKDVLVSFFNILGKDFPEDHFLVNLYHTIERAYFSSKGSITTGLRNTARAANSELIKYNQQMRQKKSDIQIRSGMILGVFRDDELFLLQTGKVKTLNFLGENHEIFHDSTERSSGLGFAQSLDLTYFQTKIKENALLFFGPSETGYLELDDMFDRANPSMGMLQKRIIEQKEPIQCAILQIRNGNGEIRHLKPKSAKKQDPDVVISDVSGKRRYKIEVKTPLEEKFPEVETGQETIVSEIPVEPIPVKRREHLPPERFGSERKNEPAVDTQVSFPREEEKHSRLPVGSEQREEVKTESKPDPQLLAAREKELRQRKIDDLARRKKIAASWLRLKDGFSGFQNKFNSIFQRLIPGLDKESESLSTGTMLMISVSIPLIVVLIASMIYFRSGRSQQQQTYIKEAEHYALLAVQSEDASGKIINWQEAVHWLDQAEEYGQTEYTVQIRTRANQELDQLYGIERVNLNSLLSVNFDEETEFVEIASGDTDLYLLDSSTGSAARLFLTGAGYQLDTGFICGPNLALNLPIGKLVDIFRLPDGSPDRATLFGIDKSGNTVYCIPGAESPMVSQLIPPEDGWGEITSVAYDQGVLLVLDHGKQTLWRIEGISDQNAQVPEPFFDPEVDEEIPLISTVVDVALYGEKLYLLHRDGSVSSCVYTLFEGIKTRCETPAEFGVFLEGFTEHPELLLNGDFTQIKVTNPPDPSFYVLDQSGGSIFHFSLQLNMVRQIKATREFSEVHDLSPTAFSISPTRNLFIAYGRKLYYAALP